MCRSGCGEEPRSLPLPAFTGTYPGVQVHAWACLYSAARPQLFMIESLRDVRVVKTAYRLPACRRVGVVVPVASIPSSPTIPVGQLPFIFVQIYFSELRPVPNRLSAVKFI